MNLNRSTNANITTEHRFWVSAVSGCRFIDNALSGFVKLNFIMLEFKQYKRRGLSEMIAFKEFVGQDMSTVSVSDQDKLLLNEEFEQGYIARNPKNHADLWYVAKKYFDDNLEPV